MKSIKISATILTAICATLYSHAFAETEILYNPPKTLKHAFAIETNIAIGSSQVIGNMSYSDAKLKIGSALGYQYTIKSMNWGNKGVDFFGYAKIGSSTPTVLRNLGNGSGKAEMNGVEIGHGYGLKFKLNDKHAIKVSTGVDFLVQKFHLSYTSVAGEKAKNMTLNNKKFIPTAAIQHEYNICGDYHVYYGVSTHLNNTSDNKFLNGSYRFPKKNFSIVSGFSVYL